MITKKQFALMAQMLSLASDEFSNHGCNDLPSSTFKGWTKAEKEELCKSMQEINGDDEYPTSVDGIGDDGLMGYRAELCRREADTRLE